MDGLLVTVVVLTTFRLIIPFGLVLLIGSLLDQRYRKHSVS